MSESIKKEDEIIGELIIGNFALMEKPLAMQMTVHINNMLNTWNKRETIKVIKGMLYNEEITELSYGQSKAMKMFNNLINYYGIDYCKQWFSEIYGLEFNTKQEAV